MRMCYFFSKTMSSNNRFLEIMRYLHFDLKTVREEIFCMMNLLSFYNLGIFFTATSKSHFFLNNFNITLDEQLLHVRKFTNSSSAWLLNQTRLVWLAFDVENKNLFNGFPYVGKALCRKKWHTELRRKRA